MAESKKKTYKNKNKPEVSKKKKLSSENEIESSFRKKYKFQEIGNKEIKEATFRNSVLDVKDLEEEEKDQKYEFYQKESLVEESQKKKKKKGEELSWRKKTEENEKNTKYISEKFVNIQENSDNNLKMSKGNDINKSKGQISCEIPTNEKTISSKEKKPKFINNKKEKNYKEEEIKNLNKDEYNASILHDEETLEEEQTIAKKVLKKANTFQKNEDVILNSKQCNIEDQNLENRKNLFENKKKFENEWSAELKKKDYTRENNSKDNFINDKSDSLEFVLSQFSQKNNKNIKIPNSVLKNLITLANENEVKAVSMINYFFEEVKFCDYLKEELNKGQKKTTRQEITDHFDNVSNLYLLLKFILKHTHSNNKTVDIFPLTSILESVELLEIQVDSEKEKEKIQEFKIFFKEYQNIIINRKKDALKQKILIEKEEKKTEPSPLSISLMFKPSKPKDLIITYNYEKIIEKSDIIKKKNSFFPHVIGSKYDSWEQYLNNMFHLLKEDFIEGLRTAVISLKSTGINAILPEVFEEVFLYKNGRIIDEVYSKNGILIYLRMFPFMPRKNQKINWFNTKRLISGTLLVLTNPDFKEFVFAVVSAQYWGKDGKKNRNQDYIDVLIKGVGEEHLNLLELCSKLDVSNLVVLEGKAYFESYYHFLKKMQETKPETLPFKSEIIDMKFLNNPPSYLKNNYFKITKKSLKELKNDEFLNVSDTTRNRIIQKLLDESQFKALEKILTREISVIQGPPGTGKSFIGALAIKVLLENKEKWGENEEDYTNPILVVAYTNHALDQFLCHILEFTDKIVRIGGRCKEEKLNDYMLNNLRKSPDFSYPKNFWKLFRENDAIREKLNSDKADLFQLSNLDFESFLNVFPGNYKLKLKNEISNYFANIGIFFEKQLDSKTIEEIFNFWKNFESITKQKFQKIQEYEKKINKNKLKNTSLNINSLLLNQNNENSDHKNQNFHESEEIESEESEEMEDVDYADNRKIENDFLDLDLKKIQIPCEGLYFCFMTEEERENLAYCEFFGQKNIWDLSKSERNMLFNYAFSIKLSKKFSSYQDSVDSFFERKKNIDRVYLLRDLKIIKKCDIVGMTVNGCAKFNQLLEEIHSPITIIEEAAEVLECLNINVLTRHTKQLILIGDHQQLKPHVESYNLERNYNFSISLFERLVINGINFITLEKQRRMRTHFADFIRIIYGNQYKDHESVLEYENIKGIATNLCFFKHNFEENEIETSKSKTNEFEANFIVKLTNYFVLQGYNQDQITIICMYLGQTLKIRKLLSQIQITKAIIASVDNYQGEENDIVIVSLVRSNKRNEIGFTSIPNRICVALSRARKGMFVFGDFDCLCASKKGDLWKKMVDLAKSKKCLVDSLKLSCQNHKKETIVSCAKDFDKVPEGGCKEICKIRKPCGHVCKKFCHNLTDEYHNRSNCNDNCNRNLPCGHQCLKFCCSECVCTAKVLKELLCGHSCFDLCPIPINQIKCFNICLRPKACGHLCSGKCYQNCEGVDCNEKVSKKLLCGHIQLVHCFESIKNAKCQAKCQSKLPCGHICLGNCFECFEKSLHVPCKQNCEKSFICGHKCQKQCGEFCSLCKECIKRAIESNGNKSIEDSGFLLFCKNFTDAMPFQQKCDKSLACGHKCCGLFKEKCPSICYECLKKEGTIGENEDTIISLSCEDEFNIDDFDDYMKTLELNKIKNLCNITCPICPKPIGNLNRYTNYYKLQCLKITNMEELIKFYLIKFDFLTKDMINLFLDKYKSEFVKLEKKKKEDISELATIIFNLDKKIQIYLKYEFLTKFKIKCIPLANNEDYYELNKIQKDLLKIKDAYMDYDNEIDINIDQWSLIEKKIKDLEMNLKKTLNFLKY